MKNKKNQEKEELRKRIEENKAKKLENERRTEQYQLVKNPAKIKRMKKNRENLLNLGAYHSIAHFGLLLSA